MASLDAWESETQPSAKQRYVRSVRRTRTDSNTKNRCRVRIAAVARFAARISVQFRFVVFFCVFVLSITAHTLSIEPPKTTTPKCTNTAATAISLTVSSDFLCCAHANGASRQHITHHCITRSIHTRTPEKIQSHTHTNQPKPVSSAKGPPPNGCAKLLFVQQRSSGGAPPVVEYYGIAARSCIDEQSCANSV